MFKVLKGVGGGAEKKRCQEYSIWQSYASERKKKKSFPDKQKLKEFVTTGPALEEMLKGVLHTEIKNTD